MKNTKGKKKKVTLKFSWVILFVIVSFLLIQGAMLQPQITTNNDVITELDEKIEYEKQRAEEVDKLKENVNTDEYIEKIAREKLGMIRKDEIMFIDVTGKEE